MCSSWALTLADTSGYITYDPPGAWTTVTTPRPANSSFDGTRRLTDTFNASASFAFAGATAIYVYSNGKRLGDAYIG